jgi:GTP cyclohydrolase II
MSSDATHTTASQSENAETPSKIHSKSATWDALAANKSHVLFQFGSELKALLEDAAYDEMYGVKLVAPEEG